MQLGQILDKGYKKTEKAQLPLVKSLEQKPGVQSKSRVLCMPPELNTTWAVGKPPSRPSRLTPGHTLIPTLYKERAHLPLGSEQAREPVVCSCSPTAEAGAQIKPCLKEKEEHIKHISTRSVMYHFF